MNNLSEKHLSVILPAYLEEENLRVMLPRIKVVCDGLKINYEILVIDAAFPMDGTKQLCIEMESIRYVNRNPGNDYGDAIRTGIKYACGRSIIIMDSDGSHAPELIAKLWSYEGNFDIVVVSRYVKGGNSDNTPLLRFMSKVLNITYRIVLGIPLSDVSNSFRRYDAELLKSLDLSCKNFDIVEEILVKAIKKKKIRIAEVPGTFRKRMFGETKRSLPLFILTYALTLIKLRLFMIKWKN